MPKLLNWTSLTLLASIAGFVVPIWVWRADLTSRSLSFRVASQVSLQPVPASSTPGLQITIDGAPLVSPYLSVLELRNDGAKAIPSSDFEAPIELRLQAGSSVARAQPRGRTTLYIGIFKSSLPKDAVICS